MAGTFHVYLFFLRKLSTLTYDETNGRWACVQQRYGQRKFPGLIIPTRAPDTRSETTSPRTSPAGIDLLSPAARRVPSMGYWFFGGHGGFYIPSYDGSQPRPAGPHRPLLYDEQIRRMEEGVRPPANPTAWKYFKIFTRVRTRQNPFQLSFHCPL